MSKYLSQVAEGPHSMIKFVLVSSSMETDVDVNGYFSSRTIQKEKLLA